jgi:hypothetical protein
MMTYNSTRIVMIAQREVCTHVSNPTKNIGMETYRNVYATLGEDLALQGAVIV